MPEHKSAEALNVLVMSEERHGLPHHTGSSDSLMNMQSTLPEGEWVD